MAALCAVDADQLRGTAPANTAKTVDNTATTGYWKKRALASVETEERKLKYGTGKSDDVGASSDDDSGDSGNSGGSGKGGSKGDDDDDDDDDDEDEASGGAPGRPDLSPVPTSVASTMTPDALDQSLTGMMNASVGGKQLRMADDDDDDDDDDDEEESGSDNGDDDEEEEDDDDDDEQSGAVPPPVSASASQGKVLRRDVQEAAQTLEEDEDVVTATAVEAMEVDAGGNAKQRDNMGGDGGSDSDSSEDMPIAQVHKKAKKAGGSAPKKSAGNKSSAKDDGDDDFDDEVVVAAVVDDDPNDGEVVAAAVVVEDSAATADKPKAKKRKKPGPKARGAADTASTPVKRNKDGSIRKKPGPKPGSNKKKPGPKPKGGGGGGKGGGTSSSKSAGARKRKHPERFEVEGADQWEDWPAEAFLHAEEVGSSPAGGGAVSAYDVKMSQYAASVPTAKMDAAISSRSFLSSNVEILPFPVSENIVVRSFGRIKVERDAIRGEETSGKKKKKSKATSTPTKDNKYGRVEPVYSTAASIHPVGFSCDRFEFSPIHGRMIRLRCDILDGAKVRKLRIAQKEAETRAKRAAKAKKTREENKRKKEEAEAAAAAAAAAATAQPETGTDGAAAVQADAAPSSATGPTAQPSEPAQGGGSGPVASSDNPAVPAPAPSTSVSAPADTVNGAADAKPELEPKPSTEVKEEQASGEEVKDNGNSDALDDLPTPLLTLDDDDDEYEGPIFRVMWGAGIEQNPENDYSYPYDVYSASAPLTDDVVDAVAVPLDGSGHVLGRTMVPEVGMRVSVRFDETRWYGGTITGIKDGAKKGGKKLTPGQRLLSIDYDDGNQEEAVYPDPDVLLRSPGTEIEGLETGDVEVMEIKGKPVVSATGKTAVEAWGKTLISLGLIDEMMYSAALDALEIAREEGRIEAEERIALQIKQRQEARVREREKKLKKKEEEEEAAKSAEADRKPAAVDGSSNNANTAANSSAGKVPDTPADGESKTGAATAAAPQTSVSESAASSPSKGGDDVAKGDESSSPSKEVDEISSGAGGQPEETKKAAMEVDPNREAEAEQEKEMRAKIQALREKLDDAQNEAQVASANLTEARIAALGPFFSNPFDDIEETQSNQHTWLSTIVRKEKSKMGNTGSKRKIVSAADLLERTDSFFNPDVERLIEGLPGSEFCPSYVFHTHRKGGVAGAVPSSWVHEAQIKHDQERTKKAKAVKKAKEKSKVETSKMKEKELKRKKKEEEAEERKKKKLAQEEQVKQAREDERMARLKLQVDDRLLKESRKERKKVIEAMAKNLGKEFTRRRRAAEIVASDRVENSKESQTLSDAPMVDTYQSSLPPLSRQYDVDVVRVWDFISSFESTLRSFGGEKENASLPSLDALQDAVDTLAFGSSGAKSSAPKTGDNKSKDEMKTKHREAVGLLSTLAVSLCKPLSADLFKLISSVVVTETDEESAEEASASTGGDDTLPVTDMTWREVARLSLLSDALGELGCNKHEVVAILRGWRNAGHPNSKEAKRMRRIEEFGLASLNQQLLDMAENGFVDGIGSSGRKSGVTVKVTAPCKPSASPSDWTFYLHNVKALEPIAATAIKSNLRKAIAVLKEDKDESRKAKNDEIVKELTAGMSVFESIGKDTADSTEMIKTCTEARTKILKVLDEATGDPFSTKIKSEAVYRDTALMAAEKSVAKPSVRKVDRQSMGLVDDLMMTEAQYKALDHQREAYIEESEKIKEEVERRLKREAGEDIAEDEDDDDDDDDDVSVDGKSSKKSTPSKEEGDDGDKKKAADDDDDQTHLEGKIGKPTSYDFFCGDDPSFPEVIRRCLAVLRALCASPAGETFAYPVDAQANPRYYEIILNPVSLHEIGKMLRDAGKRLAAKTKSDQDHKEPTQGNPDIAAWSAGGDAEKEIESLVADFGRSIRRISLNTACYSNVGASIISSADEMLRLFERLFFDWVLAPAELLPPLEHLDDEKCIDPHETDGTAVVLICDGCEGTFNMERIVPAMKEVPKGDWYCQRCVSGRSWGQLDPRIGRQIQRRLPAATSGTSGTSSTEHSSAKTFMGTISRCIFSRPDKSSKSSLAYVVSYADGDEEVLTLKEVDDELKAAGNSAPPIRCLEAVAESPGYGVKRGPDQGLVLEFVPPFVNPNLSDPAAQASISNSVFRDTVRSCSTLSVVDAEDMTPSEWLRLLVLLVTKCSTNDSLQEVADEMETKANDLMSELITETSKITSFYDLLPKVTDDEYEGDNDGDDEEDPSSAAAGPAAAPAAALAPAAAAAPVANGDVKMGNPAVGSTTKKHEETAMDVDVEVVEAELVEAIPVVEAAPSNDTNEAATDITKSSLSGIVSGRNSPSASGRNTPASTIGPDEVVSEEELRRRQIAKAKAKRQKEVEDCYVASAIKHMIKPTVATFEEDGFSHLVDSALAPKNKTISLASLRCQENVCDFCKLPDSALGLPLIRAPNHKEWLESMQHCASNRNCRLIAGLPSAHTGLVPESSIPAPTTDTGADKDGDLVMPDASNDKLSANATAAAGSKVSKMVSVTIRVNGELISEPVAVDEEDQQLERGMLEFLPRNTQGMQDVLELRADDDVLFVSGSLSAHECCAVAAHKARKDALVKHHRDLASDFAEKDAAATCGRTAPLGYDKVGRAYFRFQSDPSSLFIADSQGSTQVAEKRWHRFVKEEDIACIIACLGEEAPAEELRARYPEAAKLVRNQQWKDIIQKRTFGIKNVSTEDDCEEKAATLGATDATGAVPMDVDGDAPTSNSADNAKSDSEEKEEDLNVNLLDPTEKPYVPGEDILVESATGKLLWDASVIAVSKDRSTDQVNGYRVHYKEWSSRFDEWVDILRVVEPSEYNIEVQTELLDEYFDTRGDGVPSSLEGMVAAKYLNSANRERGSAPVPNFSDAISVGPGATIEDESIGKLKAGLLLIEAALPRGSIDSSVWTPEKANSWRSMVCNATGPGSLMGSLLVLETSILADLFYPQGYYLLQCLQTPWRAQNSASTVSVALRLSTLDRAIKFDVGSTSGRGGRKKRNR